MNFEGTFLCLSVSLLWHLAFVGAGVAMTHLTGSEALMCVYEFVQLTEISRSGNTKITTTKTEINK